MGGRAAPGASLMPMGQVRRTPGRAAPRPPDRRGVPLGRPLGGGDRVAARVGLRRRQPRRRDVRVGGGRACRSSSTAADAGLVVHRVNPLNCETSIPALIGGVVMPNARFYVRNHFETPALDPTTWRLEVGGLVERPLRVEPARPAEHAVADAGRDARVRRQRPLRLRPAGRRRAVAARRGEHGRVDGRAAGRGPRPRRRASPAPARSCSAAPTAGSSKDRPNPSRSSAASRSTTPATRRRCSPTR